MPEHLPENFKLGILGHPLGHSLSPVMHEFLLEKSGLKGSYTPWDTLPDDLEKTLQRLYQENVWGLNLTIPHKTSVLPFLEDLTPEAKIIGAVNTLTRTDTGWRGDNTDASGFWRGIPEQWKESIYNQNVVVLGSGGAARAILSCFLKYPPKTLTLICRNTSKGETLLEDLHLLSSKCLSWEAASFKALLPTAHWLIQTTPLGMAGGGNEMTMPFDTALFRTAHPDLNVSDLVYRPSQTPLLKAAEARGFDIQNGLPMLIYQGIEAFETWTRQCTSTHVTQLLFEKMTKEVF